ncbi:MAG: histidine phosphatase family protein, partial [Gammaproteobacteria bacterium]
YRKDKDWVKANFPQHKTDPDFVYPEGESFRQMQERSVGFLLRLEARYPERTLLVVVHAGVVRGFVCHLLGLDYAANLKQKVSHRYIGDFRIEDGRCVAYDELGEPSGFVRHGVVDLPYRRERWPSERGSDLGLEGSVRGGRLLGRHELLGYREDLRDSGDGWEPSDLVVEGR